LVPSFQGAALAQSWSFSDGFERTAGSPQPWYIDGGGSYQGVFHFSASNAHSGSQYARLWASSNGGSWASVARNVRVPYSTSSYDVGCSVGFYVRPYAVLSTLTSVPVNIEVIDPATWTYLAFKTHTVSASSSSQPSYKWLTSSSWSSRQPDVVVRVAVGGSTLYHFVDDMKVSCTYYF
jgi:hypothetical protein